MRLPILAAACLATPALAPAQPSTVVLPWSEGAIYPVATMPGRVTDIALEPGEALAGTGPVAAGDTARWIIGDSESGAGAAKRRHVLVKPTEAGLATNLVIHTDRRTYHVELRATPATYMARVAWRYPAGELTAVRGQPSVPVGAGPAAAPQAPDVDLTRLNFAWRVEGRAAWRPERVFDDGRRVVIDFPAGAAEMPPLFERAPGSGALQLLNYRVSGRRIVTDRLFTEGELRLGAGTGQVRVRLTRTAAP